MARSLLYRSRFLRPNTHFSAFFEIYKIDIPLHRFNIKKSEIVIKLFRFFQKFWFQSGAKVCESCRSRKMLKNAPTLAIRGVDTAENEPTFEPMARAGSRADGFLRALTRSQAGDRTDMQWCNIEMASRSNTVATLPVSVFTSAKIRIWFRRRRQFGLHG